ISRVPINTLGNFGVNRTPQNHIRNDEQYRAYEPSKRHGSEWKQSPTFGEIPETGNEDIDESHGKHELPGEVHQLIHPQTGQRAAHPNKYADDREQFQEKPQVGGDPIQKSKGRK